VKFIEVVTAGLLSVLLLLSRLHVLGRCKNLIERIGDDDATEDEVGLLDTFMSGGRIDLVACNGNNDLAREISSTVVADSSTT
jgi:hypothetical protein